MVALMLFYSILLSFTGVGLVLSFQPHTLTTLISIEYLVSSVYLLLTILIMTTFSDVSFMLVYLVTSVCSGVLGVSLLVTNIRHFGGDYTMMSTPQW